ncbi:universal stress protein [Qipengyuania sp. DY56-A-20]|jgi:universal stress protein F|uniref:Universal stress protein n=1 Tax=Qipengyuania benthica TaxID=3067651 RepID=A0ABT9H521_9SPHN|nr:universal stress protein [Qipengyuania sp. DY56-A-20]MDP4538149.1 universal stress protein [Qipengyuania sp. DY56-A-20]
MYSSVLVPVDLDEPSSWAGAVPAGLALARCFGARITLGTIVPDSLATREAQWSGIGYRRLLDTAAARLASLAEELRGDAELATRVGSGPIARGILDLAQSVEADLIVLSSHRPEMKDWLIGAQAARVVRHARCSVMVVRD